MLFLLLCLGVSFLVAFVLALLGTGRKLKQHRLAGPRAVGEQLAKRNKVVLFVVLAILVVLAFFEAIIYDLSLRVQDLPYLLLGSDLPPWAVVVFGNGSISWAFYLALFLGVLLGIVAGTLLACRRYNELKALSARDILFGPKPVRGHAA